MFLYICKNIKTKSDEKTNAIKSTNTIRTTSRIHLRHPIACNGNSGYYLQPKTLKMSKAILKKAIKKAIRETGFYNNVKVYDVVIDEDYTGKTWINIEISADEKKIKKK